MRSALRACAAFRGAVVVRVSLPPFRRFLPVWRDRLSAGLLAASSNLQKRSEISRELKIDFQMQETAKVAADRLQVRFLQRNKCVTAKIWLAGPAGGRRFAEEVVMVHQIFPGRGLLHVTPCVLLLVLLLGSTSATALDEPWLPSASAESRAGGQRKQSPTCVLGLRAGMRSGNGESGGSMADHKNG